MNILNFCSLHAENPLFGGGGQGRASHNVARHLSRKHTLTSISSHWPDCPSEEVVEGVQYRHIGWGPNKALSRISFSFEAMRTARVADSDILIEHLDPYCPTFAVAVSPRPVVFVVHNNFFDGIKKHPWVAPVSGGLLRYQLSKGLYAIAVSQAVKESIVPWMPQARMIEVIPNGIDAKLLSASTAEKDYLLFLGRLDIYAKGLDYLIEALPLMQRPVQVIIAGDGEDRGKLEQMIADADLAEIVEMVGWVEGEKKSELLRNCMAVVMPSRYEGWPLVAIEAAAYGKAVVGHPAGGLKEAVVDGRTGLLVETGDVTALAGSMDTIVSDPDLRRRLGREARRLASQWTWEQVAASYERFLNKVVAQRRDPKI